LNRLRAARIGVAAITGGLGGAAVAGAEIAGVVILEKLAKSTYERAKAIQQIALSSNRTGFSFQDTAGLAFAAQRVNKPPDYFDSAVKSAGGVQQLADRLKELSAINDPLMRVDATWKAFGADTEKILPLLGSRFAENIERAKSWGFTLDEVSRSRIDGFNKDMLALKGTFDGVGDSIAAAKQNLLSLLQVDFAGLYAVIFGSLKDGVGAGADFLGNLTRDPMDSLKGIKTGARKGVQDRQSGDMLADAQKEMLRTLTTPAEKQFAKDFGDRDQESGLRAEIAALQKKLFVQDQTSPNFGKLVSGASFEGGYGGLAESLQKLTSAHNRLQAIMDAKKTPVVDRPFNDLMKAMDAELDGVKAKMDAIGKGAGAEVLANAFADARKEITEVNKQLESASKPKPPLTKFVGPLQPGVAPSEFDKSEEGQVRYKRFLIDSGKGEAAWKEKIDASTVSMNDRITAQLKLADAISKGYEATKAATVEASGIAFLGDKYNKPDWMGTGAATDTAAQKQHRADYDAHQAAAGAEVDANHRESVEAALRSVQDQINLERALASVQANGIEAVRMATLAQKLMTLARGENLDVAKKQMAVEIDLFNAEKTNSSAAEVGKLREETAALDRVTEATWRGAEATRQANLEGKYSQMRSNGTVQSDVAAKAMAGAGASPEDIAKMRANSEAATDATIEAARTKDVAEHQQQVSAEAAKTGMEYKNHLEIINEEIAAIKALPAAQRDSIEAVTSLRNLENERLKVMLDQLTVTRNQRDENLQLQADIALAQGRAQDGVSAFMIQMQQQAKTAASIIYNAENKMLDGTSDQVAKLLTGQKTSWGKMFQNIGHDMIAGAFKSFSQTELGALGKKLGIGGKAGAAAAPLGPGLGPDGKPLTFGNGGLLGTGKVPKLGSDLPGFGLPDGTSSNPFYVVSDGTSGPNPSAAIPGVKPLVPQQPQKPNPWLTLLGSFLGGLTGAAIGIPGGGGGGGDNPDVHSSISYPGFASGTDSTPAGAYWVGENGPELMSGAGRQIASNTQSRRMLDGGGAGAYYSIDARGADAAQVEDRVKRALVAVHGSAVSTSVQTVNDQKRRVPRRG